MKEKRTILIVVVLALVALVVSSLTLMIVLYPSSLQPQPQPQEAKSLYVSKVVYVLDKDLIYVVNPTSNTYFFDCQVSYYSNGKESLTVLNGSSFQINPDQTLPLTIWNQGEGSYIFANVGTNMTVNLILGGMVVFHGIFTVQVVVLYVSNVNFYGNGTKIDIDIGNSGNSDTTITQVQIGSPLSSMNNVTITPVPLPAGAVRRITVNYSWQDGLTYSFEVVVSIGQSLQWYTPTHGAEQGQLTNLLFSTSPQSILVTFNNTGTSAITVNEVWVNGIKQATFASGIIPYSVPANQGYLWNVTASVVSGYQYSVTLVSAVGNRFTSTGTAPS